MRIERISTLRLRIPFPRPRVLPRAEEPVNDPPPDAIHVVLVQINTDDGLQGLGYAPVFVGSSSIQSFIDDELIPRLIGSDPLRHELIGAMIQRELPLVFRGGIAAHAFAALDIALWDIKGKVAKQPLHQLLGGRCDGATTYFAETGWSGWSGDQVLELASFAREKNLAGFRVSVGGDDAIRDAQKIQHIRDSVGEDVWFGVSCRQNYDTATALAFGRFLEEELDADWYEDPVAGDDIVGHKRLAEKLDIPLAVGAELSAGAIKHLATGTDVSVLRLNVLQLGGITNWLRTAGFATARHRLVVPPLLPEVNVHLACGRTGIHGVEYVRWLEPLWKSGPVIRGGKLSPPTGPGLGLDLDADALARFQV